MDHTYGYPEDSIFLRRMQEWDMEEVKTDITELFKTVEVLDGWKFVKSSWGQDTRKRTEELKRNIIRNLNITVTGTGEVTNEIHYHLQLPELIDGQFFYIGGNYKVPLFQLFDNPIVYVSGSNIVRFRNNIIPAKLTFGEPPTITVFNKKISAGLLLACCHTKEETDALLETMNPIPNETVRVIYDEACIYWDKSFQERVSELGGYFYTTGTTRQKKGEMVVFSMKVAYLTDIYTKRYMKTDSIIFELLNAVHEGTRDDNDLKNKRIRFKEYILANLVRKVYDLIISMYRKKLKKIRFQIPSSIVVEGCNVSDIIHYNNVLNPVGEIASFCQCTLVGPGSFKKTNVPPHLRDLHASQKGFICPADTPDRDGCGVILNIVPDAKIDPLGYFSTPDPNLVCSYPITLTPFLKNDDQTRLQMHSNQCKQSILITNGDLPMARSGNEGNYLEFSSFYHVAKEDGIVLYVDHEFMVVVYNNKECEVFKIGYKKLYLNTVEQLIPVKKEGQIFEKGATLAQSRFIRNGELALGKNLLTCVGIYKGLNYEDGIVISKSVAETKYTSLHFLDLSFVIENGQVMLNLNTEDRYCPLPRVGQKLKKNDVYAKLKYLNYDDGFESINYEPVELTVPVDCEVVDVQIFPNTWNKKIAEFDKFIEEKITDQTSRASSMKDKLRAYFEDPEIRNLLVIHNITQIDTKNASGTFAEKGKRYEGIHVKIKAVYEEKISIGDKIANRHGNKGIIAKIQDDDKMPMLEDGRRAEIVINTLGIISRMNAGQLFELHVTEALYQLKKKMKSFEDFNQAYNLLSDFMDIFDVTETKWVKEKTLETFSRLAEKVSLVSAINRLNLICPPFEDLTPPVLDKLMNFIGAKYAHEVYDPELDLKIKNPLACGYIYFTKLVHRANEKLSARSIGPYSQKTQQPLGGKSRHGGHRLGEMEVWAIIAHGAQDFIKDLLTTHSDSTGLKNKILADILENPNLKNAMDQKDIVPQAKRLLDSYMKVIGVEFTHDQEGE